MRLQIIPQMTFSAAVVVLSTAMLATVFAQETPELLWSDEFQISGPPDANNWNLRTGMGSQLGWGNGELQVYTDNSQNVAVRDDFLQITAIRHNDDTFTSARIDTDNKMEVKYGTIIARIQIPDL